MNAAAPGKGRHTERKVLAAFVIALACLSLIALAGYSSVVRLRDDADRVAHTREVIGGLESLFSDVTDLQNSRRGFVITGQEPFVAAAEIFESRLAGEIRRLRQLVADNGAQDRRIDAVAAMIDAQIRFAHDVTLARRDRGFGEARELTASRRGEDIHTEIRRLIDEMKRVEEQLLVERADRTERSVRRAKIVILAGSAMAFVFVGVASVVIRRELGARQRAEEAVRHSEKSLAVTLNSIGDGVLATDTAGKVTRINAVAERLTGWTEAEARGRPVAEVFHLLHEKTRARVPVPVDAVLASGEIRLLDPHTAIVSRDGRERSIDDSAAPIRDANGEPQGVVLVFRDVSEKRAIEERLAATQEELERFFTLSLDFLCISSVDGYFKRVSPAVTDILGWTVPEFLAQPYLELVHPDDHAATLRQVERQVRSGEKVLQFENRYRHQDGTWRTLSWRSVPHAGGLMYASARDVTEQRRVEDEIRRLNSDLQLRAAQAAAANQELEAFSYSVSHDLRAPLRHIQGYVGMLARESQGQMSDKGKRFLNTIGDASREMGQLIDDLLAFARIGRAEMRLGTVELEPLITEVRQSQELATQGRTITWHIAPLPAVQADRALLKQVWANLLGNAVKYTRPRNPAVIEIGCAGEENGCVTLFVRDNGVGFDLKYAKKLFAVFQRLHRQEEFEGTGVGLANVQRIVQRHGGRVWAHGEVGQGAVFSFTLRRAASAPSLPSHEPEKNPAGG